MGKEMISIALSPNYLSSNVPASASPTHGLYKMAYIPKSDQSQNTSRNYKSEKEIG
jgi:hypothetical protein